MWGDMFLVNVKWIVLFFSRVPKMASALKWKIYGNNKLAELLLLFVTINNKTLIEHVCDVTQGLHGTRFAN